MHVEEIAAVAPKAHHVPAMLGNQEVEFRADIRERGIRGPIEVIRGNLIVDDRR